jgi:hypothetical protein
MRAVVLALTLCACIEPAAEVHCGDLICPASSVCLPTGTCATQEDVAACMGIADGAACQTMVFAGTCRGGVCYPPVCGDGFIEGSEQCDGPVTGTDCVDYGFDTGLPVCNSCVLDVIHSCVRFGWHQIASVTARAAWTDGTNIAAINADNSGVEILANRNVLATLDRPNEFFVAGGAHVIAIAGTTELWLWNGSAFTSVDVTQLLQNGANIQRLQVGPDDTLYVVTISAAQALVWSRSPSATAWTQMRFSATNDYDAFVVEDGQILYAHKTGPGSTVQRWNGTSWVATALATASESIFDLHARGSLLFAATATHVVVVGPSGTTTFTESAGQIAPLDSGLYAGGGGGNAVDRLQSTTWIETIDAPIQGTLFSHGNDLYIVGNGIYAYDGAEYAVRFSPSPTIEDLALLENGMPVAVGLFQGFVPTPQNRISWTATSFSTNPVAVAGKSDTDYYVTDGQALVHAVNQIPTTVATAPPMVTLRDMWMTGNTLYAVGSSQASFVYTGTTLMPLAAPPGTTSCDVTSVTGTATDVFAGATCGPDGGGVWQLNGTTWTEIHHTPYHVAGIATDPAGDLFTTGPSGGARFVAGVWTDDPGALGLSISATSPDDVWVAGGQSSVIHWDGVAWSRLGVVGASRPKVVATSRQVTMSGVAVPVLVR